MKTAEFGKPCAAVAAPGKCRICGCTRITACDVPTDYGSRACGWADAEQTLCDATACLEAARAEITVRPAPDLTCPYDGPRYGFAP